MSFIGTLRPYQEAVVKEMIERQKVLLAVEQGVGKTPCSIYAIESMFDSEQITAPGLVICLSTLKDQWSASIEQFTGGSSTSLIIPSDTTPAKRAAAYERARNWEADYIILNYEQVVGDIAQVTDLPLGFIIVDEASFIRGFSSARAKAVKKLGKNCPVKYALTGTPIENGKPEEFFSIMEFVDPEVFGNHSLFDRTYIVRNKFGQVNRYRNIPEFHKVLGTAMIRLRADDPEVSPYMPDTDDQPPVLVRLDRAAAAVYNTIAAELLFDLQQVSGWGGSFNVAANYGRAAASGGSQDMARARIGQKMLALQMLCDHPELLRRSAHRYDTSTGKEGSGYIAGLRDRGLLDDLTEAPKMDRTIQWINERLDASPKNKIVLFTRYVGMAEIIHEALGDISSLYTGKLGTKKKTAALTRFQQEPDCRVLVATDAGGFGLDIPQANLLINYDLPDGAGLADQRDTRIVRTSSDFPVVSRNWIQVEESLEVYKMARLSQKRKVRDAFVDARGLTDKGGVVMSADSLATFLRASAM